MRLLHEELTYKLRGCFYEVHNNLKIGFDEESYHLALEHCLRKNNIAFQTKVGRHLEHRGQKVHKFIADLIVEGKVILELKNIKGEFSPANYVQIISYLKFWQLDLGLLVNFGRLKVDVERIPFSEKDLLLWENYDGLEDRIYFENQPYFDIAKEAIITIFEMHGLSYDTNIYRAIFQTELAYQEIDFRPNVLVPVKYEERVIRQFELNYPVLYNTVLCGIIAGSEEIIPEIAKMKTYLKALNLPIGIIGNFRKNKLEIIGVCP